MKIGAHFIGEGTCEFVVWAPHAKTVALDMSSPEQRVVPLERDARGYWRTEMSGVSEAARYRYRLDGITARPDPASHHQPQGVHEASQVVRHASYAWNDGHWRGIPVSDMIMYELHVGTFTGEGTFEAIIPRLGSLRDLGINAIELMPVAQFPGERNWGYDGVYPFAVQHSYGGPAGLKRLVDAAHQHNVAVILDVVYNHLGPEGNYLAEFGPYFTDRYRTPWGKAVNVDGPYSDDVRNYFIENALHWFTDYHVDALRLDAVHAITDMSARPFLQELAIRVSDYSQKQQREHYLIAESNLNDSKTLRPIREEGHGLHAQWLDDFHHCVHTLLTGERDGYYCDFGRPAQLAKSLNEGFVYSGDYSEFRKRRHGNSSSHIPPRSLVAFTSNHDQIGNRMRGERMVSLVSFEGAKLHAAATLLSPFVPMIFMGEEYADPAPFKYFVSHSDADVIEAVRKGRREEFSTFAWQGSLPDPQSEGEFLDSKLDWQLRETGANRVMRDVYAALISLRTTIYAGEAMDRHSRNATSIDDARVILLLAEAGSRKAMILFNFNTVDSTFPVDVAGRIWTRTFDTAEERWGGPGSLLAPVVRSSAAVTMRPLSAAVYVSEQQPMP
jgi:maltooligosyltrehalose trehalohydrolase